ncbi:MULTISPECIES: hypothetical protein [unclassified Clostridium]|uniref:hypothetical protein n=1 Tax=unclassified Clostridium TaxID=2614128 RepID=UPI00029755FF|nr:MULTISPECIES: hypothetical protein [unclassified Clostridium]EKQ50279.1 MAG: hypothetical protein A370_05725 [Clostridium sp. Maddingley MBC34-26]
MKKDHIRDYATEAFRFYALVGMSAIEYREKIRNEAINTVVKRMGKGTKGGSPTEAQLIYADKAIEEKLSEIQDLEAVEKTMKEFEADVFTRITILPLIKAVYFTEADKEIKKGEIRNRVIKACSDLSISESTAYRYLKRARLLFAHNRGLRAGEVERINYY